MLRKTQIKASDVRWSTSSTSPSYIKHR